MKENIDILCLSNDANNIEIISAVKEYSIAIQDSSDGLVPKLKNKKYDLLIVDCKYFNNDVKMICSEIDKIFSSFDIFILVIVPDNKIVVLLDFYPDNKIDFILLTFTQLELVNRIRLINNKIESQEDVELKNNFNILFNLSNEFIFVLNNNGDILEVNNYVLSKLNYSLSELIGKSIFNIIPEKDLEKIKNKISKNIENEKHCNCSFVSKLDINIPVEASISKSIWKKEYALFLVGKDISEVKYSEEKFSKAFYLNASLISISTLKDGKFIDINNSFLEKLKYSRNEIIGKTSLEINLFKLYKDRKRIASKVLRYGYVREFETSILTKDGELRYGLLSADLITIQNKKCLLSVFDDTTERKLQKAKYLESEIKYRSLVEQSHDGVFIYRGEKFLFVNSKATKITGYSIDELYKMCIWDIIHSDDLVKMQLYSKKRINGEDVPNTYTARIISKKGNIVYLEFALSIINYGGEKAFLGNVRDISLRIAAQEKLQNAISRLNNVLDASINVAIIATNSDGIITLFNSGAEKILGYNSSEIVNKKTPLFIHYLPQIKERAKELSLLMNTKIEGFETLTLTPREIGFEEREWIYVKKDGSHINVNLNVTVIRNINNDITGYLGVALDITKRKDDEEKIKRNLKRQKLFSYINQELNKPDYFDKNIALVFNQLKQYLNATSVQTYIVDYNKCILKKDFYDNLIDIKIKDTESLNKILSKQCCVISFRDEGILKDIIENSNSNNCSYIILPIKINEDIISYLIFIDLKNDSKWYFSDIDFYNNIVNILSNAITRESVSQRLIESETQLKLALESANEGIWDWDMRTNKIYVNSMWMKLLAYDKVHFVFDEKDLMALIHPDDIEQVSEKFQNHRNQKSKYYIAEYRIKTKSNNWKWVLAHGKIVEFDDENKPLRAIGTLLDISKQKELEVELKELNATKDKFFSIIAHDLRNPFSNILGFTELLLNDESAYSKREIYDIIGVINEIANSTYSLLNNLLEWSRIQRNKIKLQKEKFNLKQAVENSVYFYKNTAIKKDIKLECSINENISVYADNNMFSSIIQNLISNAIKFTFKNGEITISASFNSEYNNFIEISVKDTGIGMSEERKNVIFNIDNDTSNKGTDGETGSGLGLTLCAEFVKLNNGEIWVESEEGFGSKFTFTMPLNK